MIFMRKTNVVCVFAIFLSVVVILACLAEHLDKHLPRTYQRQVMNEADALQFEATMFNAVQTNWIMTITPRINK